jgi:hypothetical protein
MNRGAHLFTAPIHGRGLQNKLGAFRLAMTNFSTGWEKLRKYGCPRIYLNIHREWKMIDFKRTVLLSLSLLLAVLFCASPLCGQELKKKAKAEPPPVIIPIFPGENLEKVEKKVNPAELISGVMDKLGGAAAYKALQDLTYEYKLKHYTKNDDLLFVETATGYVKMGDRLKSRLDINYPLERDINVTLDYREVRGDDGPFMFREGKILRTPANVENAGHRLFRNDLQLLAPFLLNLEDGKPTHRGDVTWNVVEKGKTKEIRCHKILLKFNRKYAGIENGLLALYIEPKTKTLMRMVYKVVKPEPEMKFKKFRIIDFESRVKVGGVQLPSVIKITEIRNDELEGVLYIYYTGIKANLGLKGIGFELADQLD